VCKNHKCTCHGDVHVPDTLDNILFVWGIVHGGHPEGAWEFSLDSADGKEALSTACKLVPYDVIDVTLGFRILPDQTSARQQTMVDQICMLQKIVQIPKLTNTGYCGMPSASGR
jgi:hypothetical protein